jgi:DNA repair protein RadA/Sms
MSKNSSIYICQNCGAKYAKWQGSCDACGAWNSIEEEAGSGALPKGISAGVGGKLLKFASIQGDIQEYERLKTGIGEFDRVLGGGLVKGSAILIGGDPGIGKSTLLLQAMNAVSRQVSALYISGEESISQIRMRAKRLGLDGSPMLLACETNVKNIVASIEKEKPDVVVIDSIQTMFSDLIDSAPGTVSQVKTSGNELIRVAKTLGTILLIVGHVTKEGMIAGPRVLVHMVDTVL